QRMNEAADTQVRTDLAQLRQALAAYYTANNGQYPSTGGSWWCENCTLGAEAKGADQWIPDLVSRGYIKRLPTAPNNGVGNGFDGCVGSNAAYMYMSLPTQPGYKLIAHCVPTSGLNQAEAKPPSAYCTVNVGSWEDGRYGL